MAVTWSWKAKIGEANWTTVSGKTKKVTIYRGNCFDGLIKKIKLNTYYTEATKIAEQFAKAGIKAELYYKEPKKSKKSALTL